MVMDSEKLHALDQLAIVTHQVIIYFKDINYHPDLIALR